MTDRTGRPSGGGHPHRVRGADTFPASNRKEKGVTSRRKTHALLQVATVLMDNPDGRHWGYDTAKAAGVRPATMYRTLTRMLDDGWLADGWEDPAETSGRPPRRYYTVTEKGRAELYRICTGGER